jgi:hypothetical protein
MGDATAYNQQQPVRGHQQALMAARRSPRLKGMNGPRTISVSSRLRITRCVLRRKSRFTIDASKAKSGSGKQPETGRTNVQESHDDKCKASAGPSSTGI